MISQTMGFPKNQPRKATLYASLEGEKPMSSPNGEPMLPASYDTREESIERLCCQDAVAVASEPRAMAAALEEYITLQMFERGLVAGLLEARQTIARAEMMALIEYEEAPITKKAVIK